MSFQEWQSALPKFEVHPAASVFPMLNDEQLKALADDIQQNGQNEPIIVWNNLIVDGRNRHKACEMIDVEPRVAELNEDTDPVAYAISANIHRRHLDVGQRAMIAAKLATMKRGSNQHTKEDGQICLSTSEAAVMLNVSPRSVKTAKHVLEHGTPGLVQAVEQQELSLHGADQLCKQALDDGIEYEDVETEAIADDEPTEAPQFISLAEALRGASKRNSVNAEYLANKTGLKKSEIQAWLKLSGEAVGYKAVQQDDNSFAIHKLRIQSDKQFINSVKSQSIHGDATPAEALGADLDSIGNKIEGVLRLYSPGCKDFSAWRKLDPDDKRNLTFLLTSAMAKVASKFPIFLEQLSKEAGQ